jgi:hypothetical protein
VNSQNYLVTFVNGTLTVNKATPGQNGTANVTLTSSPNPPIAGQPITLTATVPPGATGTVTFMDGTTVLGTATIVGNTATLTITLAAGSHPVTAVYNGNSNYNPATSEVDTVVVGQSLDFTLTLISSGSQTVIPGNAASYTRRMCSTICHAEYGIPSGAMALASTGNPFTTFSNRACE